MKKIAIAVVFSLFLVGALCVTASLALDSVQVSGKILFKKGAPTPTDAVVFIPLSDGAYGAEVNREGKFVFYIPLHFGFTEAQVSVWSESCTGNKLVQVSPNSCAQINLRCR